MSEEGAEVLLFSGSSHPELAKGICEQPGICLGKLKLGRFPDGETSVKILENVRGRDVFVLQTIALHPNDYFMELLIIVDALRRASAKSIGVVTPYFGYCRQDRKDQPRAPITAKLVANLIVTSGASSVMTMDLHALQLQGFFDIPVDNLYGRVLLVEAFRKWTPQNLVVVAPDVGSVKLARAYASQLGVDFAIVDKQRENPSTVGVCTVIGNVKGKDILLADDMCSTGDTLVSAAKACQEKGAKRIFAAVTHGLWVQDALQQIEHSPIEKVLTSDTIPDSGRLHQSTKVEVVSVAHLFGSAIRCMIQRESISSLFEKGQLPTENPVLSSD